MVLGLFKGQPQDRGRTASFDGSDAPSPPAYSGVIKLVAWLLISAPLYALILLPSLLVGAVVGLCMGLSTLLARHNKLLHHEAAIDMLRDLATWTFIAYGIHWSVLGRWLWPAEVVHVSCPAGPATWLRPEVVSLYCPAGAGPIGLILTQEAWGLLVILPPLPDQPRQEELVEVMESVRRQYPRCTSIALDDQLQWQMLQQHAMHVSEPFVPSGMAALVRLVCVSGELGLLSDHAKDLDELVIAVVGGGTALGRQLAPLLASIFKKVISVDASFAPHRPPLASGGDDVVMTCEGEAVSEADAVLVLHSDGLEHYAKYSRPGQQWGLENSVNPLVKQRLDSAGADVFWVSVGIQDLRVLPGTDPCLVCSSDVPPSLLAALVHHRYGSEALEGVESCQEACRELGVAAALTRIPLCGDQERRNCREKQRKAGRRPSQ